MVGSCLQANVDANKSLFPYGPAAAVVRRLDWSEPLPAAHGTAAAEAQQGSLIHPYIWRQCDLDNLQDAQARSEVQTVHPERRVQLDHLPLRS